jgi:hypothetical protein
MPMRSTQMTVTHSSVPVQTMTVNQISAEAVTIVISLMTVAQNVAGTPRCITRLDWRNQRKRRNCSCSQNKLSHDCFSRFSISRLTYH